ncbi:trypsin-like serine protease [Pseudomonas sp. SH10-3B]|uniref:trypsin-like serine protease n=1 Tax=Pseudomonas sp. SH10-3B TaxID=2816049 RepID=UPI001CA712FB|nr:trypsin-like serine protease [Pseudomonas sp. SH10-3B]MBY8945172.1 trypsin-like serine protease [Pseudomonas sp. SH10-3B]
MRNQWLLIPVLMTAAIGTPIAMLRYYTIQETVGKDNLAVLDGHVFKNAYNPLIKSSLTPEYYAEVLREAVRIGCRGGDAFSTNTVSADAVLNCFQRNNGEDKSGEAIYNSLKGKVTSITYNGMHFCMASYVGKLKWVTAAHCFLGKASPYDNYKILLDRPYDIKVTVCDKKNCDVALVEPSGMEGFDEGYTPLNTSLATISSKTQLFVPGVEINTPIPGNNIDGVSEVIMWSKIKNACIPYEVRSGCIAYTCSTLTGFSGAPVYAVKNNSVSLVGVHSGGGLGGECAAMEMNTAVTSDILAEILK